MKFTISATKPEKTHQACLIVGVFENGEMTETARKVDTACGGHLSAILKQGTFRAKKNLVLPIFFPGKSKYEHILLVGCGKKEVLRPETFRQIVVNAMKGMKDLKLKQAICYLTELKVQNDNLAWKIKQIVEATSEALYCFDMFKTAKKTPQILNEIIIHVDKIDQSSQAALNQGIAVAASVTLTKNLGNLPSNICTPTFLADQAKALAKTHRSLAVNILNEKEMKKLGMGALLAVSQGSSEEAKLICMEYKGGGKKTKPYAFIGKGVTFDTGGNSIKPADSMVGMKYDMCGAASVLGLMQAVAMLKLPLNIVGIVPAVENMPGGTAYKPEDILTSMSGQTIEVISTDAEGRLALCDALTYCERYNPEVVIDIATLTGAVIIALGFQVTGLLSNNDTLAQELVKASNESNDRAWQLPLYEEYQEQLKSPFADMMNVGGRAAGTITAGAFLSRFAKKFAWAHLDVAGTAAKMMGTTERLATGRPVPMLVQYLLDRVNHRAT